jgi:hypothetical protein
LILIQGLIRRLNTFLKQFAIIYDMLNKKQWYIQVEGYITQAMLLVRRQSLLCHRVILKPYFSDTTHTRSLTLTFDLGVLLLAQYL